MTRFRGWTLAGRLRIALATFSTLLIIAVVAIVLALRQADRALADQTQRILPARTAASQLLTALVDQETGLRGYAITHQQSYLEPYRTGLANQKTIRAQLDAYVRPQDPAHLDLLSVDAAITAWSEEYAQLRLHDVLSGGTTTTIEFGRTLFDDVRATNARLDARLAAEARSAESQAYSDRRLVVVVGAVMALAVAAALLGFQRSLRSMVLRPLRALGEQVAVVSGGSYDHAIAATGPPDLRVMGEGVELMRLELARALAEAEASKADLERRATELARSNADLQQFAYVASHDLQEPLRKVASFCQALELRYGGQFDERGEQYLAFAADGAKRMQQLVSDLLEFSRVGRTSEGFVPVRLDAQVNAAWADLDARVQEAAGHLEIEGLDLSVPGDGSLLRMLFVNLLGNSLKYRRPDRAPHVRVSAAVRGRMVQVDVADDGIGIPSEYAEKVFVIFQRLHARDEYGGTGIGLALCKKIVEFHGGTIGLGPSALGGVCVSFTLPLAAEATGA